MWGGTLASLALRAASAVSPPSGATSAVLAVLLASCCSATESSLVPAFVVSPAVASSVAATGEEDEVEVADPKACCCATLPRRKPAPFSAVSKLPTCGETSSSSCPSSLRRFCKSVCSTSRSASAPTVYEHP